MRPSRAGQTAPTPNHPRTVILKSEGACCPHAPSWYVYSVAVDGAAGVGGFTGSGSLFFGASTSGCGGGGSGGLVLLGCLRVLTGRAPNSVSLELRNPKCAFRANRAKVARSIPLCNKSRRS